MHQRQISCDKVHTIFKNSKLNAKDYTRRLSEGCIVFIFPFVRSSFPMFIRLLVSSFVILLINCSLSLSLSPFSLPSPSPSSLSLSLSLSRFFSLSRLADADLESFDSYNVFFYKSNAVLDDEGRDDPNITKADCHRSAIETPFDGPVFNAGLVAL